MDLTREQKSVVIDALNTMAQWWDQEAFTLDEGLDQNRFTRKADVAREIAISLVNNEPNVIPEPYIGTSRLAGATQFEMAMEWINPEAYEILTGYDPAA